MAAFSSGSEMEQINPLHRLVYRHPLSSSDLDVVGITDSSQNNEDDVDGDGPRRSSLGAESLMEHDFNDECSDFESNVDDYFFADFQPGLEYIDDIFMLNRNKELLRHPRSYIEEQPQITVDMRCTLINWLLKVNRELRFSSETIFIAVSLIDRFLALTPIAQDCLQLLAVCSLFVAAKMEESVVPGISVLVSLCGSTYRHCHFRRMETLLLSTLQFQLHSPNAWVFVTDLTFRTSRLTPIHRRTLSLAQYVIEMGLGSYSVCQFVPSQQAAAALVFSCLLVYFSTGSHQLSPDQLRSDFKNDFNELENIFEILPSLNVYCQNLMWTLREIFSCEEFEDIRKCLEAIKTYIKPFLHSFSFDWVIKKENITIADLLQPKPLPLSFANDNEVGCILPNSLEIFVPHLQRPDVALMSYNEIAEGEVNVKKLSNVVPLTHCNEDEANSIKNARSNEWKNH